MISDIIKGTEPFPTRATSRQRLKPWLTQKIENGCCPGLCWIDREQQMFRIPWKHFGKPGVDGETDAKVFRDWAIHTGKYRSGDPPDPSTWKTRFRCALYKLPDIEEQSNLNNLEGDSPYRVYKFLTKEEVANRERQRRQGDASSIADSQDTFPLSSPASSTATDRDGNATEDNEWPMPFDFGAEDALRLGIDLGANIMEDLSRDGMENPQGFIEDLISGRFEHEVHARSVQAVRPEIEREDGAFVPEPHRSSQGCHSLNMQVYYKGNQVYQRESDNPNGLRVAYKPPPPLPEDIANDTSVSVVTHIFGPFLAEQFYFPPTEDTNVLTILDLARRGIVIQTQNGDIFATRLCRAKVFYSYSFYGSPPPEELARENTTKVFSVQEFEAQLARHREGNGPPPPCELYFSIAQKWDVNHPLKDNFVYVSVTYVWAKQRLEQFTQVAGDVLVSEPNMFDQLRDQIERLYVSNPNEP